MFVRVRLGLLRLGRPLQPRIDEDLECQRAAGGGAEDKAHEDCSSSSSSRGARKRGWQVRRKRAKGDLGQGRLVTWQRRAALQRREDARCAMQWMITERNEKEIERNLFIDGRLEPCPFSLFYYFHFFFFCRLTHSAAECEKRRRKAQLPRTAGSHVLHNLRQARSDEQCSLQVVQRRDGRIAKQRAAEKAHQRRQRGRDERQQPRNGRRLRQEVQEHQHDQRLQGDERHFAPGREREDLLRGEKKKKKKKKGKQEEMKEHKQKAPASVVGIYRTGARRK